MTSVTPNQRVQRTHSRVTPLAEERKRRATRRAADAQRYAAECGLGARVVTRIAVFICLWLSFSAHAGGEIPNLPRAGRPDPIRMILRDSPNFGWADIYVGMSAEDLRSLIKSDPIVIDASPSECKGADIRVEHRLTELVVHLSRSWRKGKVLGLVVPLYDSSRTWSRDMLVRALKSRIPGLAYRPNPRQPGLAEELDPRPVYASPRHRSMLIVLVPGEALILTDRRCQDWALDAHGVFSEHQHHGTPHNHRMQATTGGAAVLNSRDGRSPAAPDAERYAEQATQ